MSVVIETTIGDITVDLFTELRPHACLNFIKLCKLKYYNYNLFHTIEQNFIAQTGDPTGAGNGGSSIWGVIEGPQKRFFEAESLPKINHTNPGLLSLVSPGKNMVGSQFFFTLDSNLTFLDGIHCVIGEVVEGFDILRILNETIVDEEGRPFQDIRITHTVILNDPFDDPRGFQVPSRSPSPSDERLKNGRIAADEDIYDTDGKTAEELQEMIDEREAKARATILEIVGDIPDADVAPPENVLFVCKLNPVTTDDDLEIIFSRFGRVKTCEVIRDKKTGDSLQYAFVEFEEQKSCEAAYFKMDNVLIDDRRIHVDFSQSVAKVKWRGKGRGVDGTQGRFDFNDLSEEKHKNKHRNNKGDRNEHRNTYNDRRHSPEYRKYDQKNSRSPHGRRSRERRNRPDVKRNNESSKRHDRTSDRKSPARTEEFKYHEKRRQSPNRQPKSKSTDCNVWNRYSRSPIRDRKANSREHENYRKRRIENNSSPNNKHLDNYSRSRGRRTEYDDQKNHYRRNTRSPARNYRDERNQNSRRSNSYSPRRGKLDSQKHEQKYDKSKDKNIEHKYRSDSTQHERGRMHSRQEDISRNHKSLTDNRSRKEQSTEKNIKSSYIEKKKHKMSDNRDKKRKNKKSKYSSSSDSSSETESDSSSSDSTTSSSSSEDESKRKRKKIKKSGKTSKKYKK